MTAMQMNMRAQKLHANQRHCDERQELRCESTAAVGKLHGEVLIRQPLNMSKQVEIRQVDADPDPGCRVLT